MRRFAPLTIMSGLAATGLVLTFAGPAVAKGHRGHGPKAVKPVNVECITLSGNSSGSPSPSLDGCTPSSATGGSGTGTFTSTDATITWANSSSTTIHYSISFPQSSGNKCAKVAKGEVEGIVHGAVSGGTPASGNPGVKGAVHAKICVATDGILSLLPNSGPFTI